MLNARFMLPALLASLILVTTADARAARPKPAPPARSLLDGLELFAIDAPHSGIDFVVPWMGVSKVHGSFHDFLGVIAYDRTDLTRSSVSVVIPTTNLSTNFERRDKDLRGPDFFDVEKYPVATFSSREIVRTSDGYLLRGDFTLHGVTKAVEIPFVDNGRLRDSAGDDRVGFEGRLTIRRKDYGIVGPPRFNRILEKGIIIGEDVEIPISIEGWKANAKDTLQDRSADSLFRAIGGRGLAAVSRDYRALRARTPDSLMAVDEGVLNDVGYQLLAHGRAADALQVFSLEAESYPHSAFAQVGLGQAYATTGNREQAIASCEAALKLNPRAVRAMEILRRVRGS
jgi:polyisoprenoid-binding protein YceI